MTINNYTTEELSGVITEITSSIKTLGDGLEKNNMGLIKMLGFLNEMTQEIKELKEQKLPKKDTYITLDEEDFKCLTRGGVLYYKNTQIALRDIGFDTMDQCIDLARDGIDIYKEHIKKQ